jgi:hypothetical protein
MEKQPSQQDNICHLKHNTVQNFPNPLHICQDCGKKFRMKKNYVCPTCGVKQRCLKHLDMWTVDGENIEVPMVTLDKQFILDQQLQFEKQFELDKQFIAKSAIKIRTDWKQCNHCNATATEDKFTVAWDFIYE